MGNNTYLYSSGGSKQVNNLLQSENKSSPILNILLTSTKRLLSVAQVNLSLGFITCFQFMQQTRAFKSSRTFHFSKTGKVGAEEMWWEEENVHFWVPPVRPEFLWALSIHWLVWWSDSPSWSHILIPFYSRGCWDTRHENALPQIVWQWWSQDSELHLAFAITLFQSGS